MSSTTLPLCVYVISFIPVENFMLYRFTLIIVHYYINTNEIPSDLSCENFDNKPHLWDQKTI